MAPRGRRPLPTGVLELRGSWRATTRKHEPAPPAVLPKPPKDLDTRGKRLWRLLARDLYDAGLLTTLDGAALARYIQLHQHWQQLHQFIQAHGECYDVIKYHEVKAHVLEDGTVIPATTERYVARSEIRPETRLWLALSDRLARLESAFGMSPQARASIGLALAVAEKVSPDVPRDPRRFLSL